MLTRIISSVLAITCIALAIALARSGERAPAALPAISPGISPNLNPVDEDHILLDRPIGDVNFDHTGLDEVIESLSKRAKITLYVRWHALEGSGIDHSAPVTVHLRNVSLRQALNVVESEVGRGIERLAHVAADGVVTISTAADIETLVISEIFDVRDLLDEMVATHAAWVNTTGAAKSTTMTYGEASEFLRKQLLAIDPESWREGGTIGSYAEIGGLLFVLQTPRNHREIRQMLERIRGALHRHEPLSAMRPESLR